MLVLSRRVDERIFVGEGPDMVVIQVTEIRGDKVKIGIQAPDGVEIDREEVRRAKLKERGESKHG